MSGINELLQRPTTEDATDPSVTPSTGVKDIEEKVRTLALKFEVVMEKEKSQIPVPPPIAKKPAKIKLDLVDLASQSTSPTSKNIPEYNILLLGETGAGKSTTINAFANYLKYASFDDAKNNEFVQLIPSKFTLPDPESGEPIDIQSGADDNEKHGDGASSTQAPVAYTFRMKDRLLRIIDTPGMGDTKGVEIDKENFEKILAHLHNYKQLHGICLLMKSNETRKTAFFRYCITELLTHLHKSACRNIVFCFTFSRNSFYGPGEGYATLRGFLQNDLKEVQLELKPNVNCYFIDNEAYRFLVAQKKGYPFPDDQESSYEDSWVKSVDQSNTMWDYIRKLVPHNLESTVSLNNARKLILELAEPMVQLQNNINANIAHIQAEEARVKNSTENKKQLAKNLMLEVDDLEMEPLGYPRTVCTAAKCTEVINYQGQNKINYKTHCHPHCYLNGVKTNTVGDAILKGCAAMASSGTHCNKCKCPYQSHMHVTVEYIKVKRTIIDTNKEKEIKNTDDAIKQIEKALAKMRQLVDEYEAEYKVIADVSSKFAVILIANSNTPYNRFIEPYLDLLMDEEMKKISAISGYPRTVYESLVKMKETHQESVRILSEAIKCKSHADVRIEDIYHYRDQLFNLKHSGPQFMQMLQTANWTKKKEFAMQEEQSLDLTQVVVRQLKNTANRLTFGIFGSGSSGGKVKNFQQQLQENYRTPKCLICDQPHKTIFCNSFLPSARKIIAETKKLCPICLIPGHELMYCRNDYKCAKCQAKHSAVICIEDDADNFGNMPRRNQWIPPESRPKNRNTSSNWRKKK